MQKGEQVQQRRHVAAHRGRTRKKMQKGEPRILFLNHASVLGGAELTLLETATRLSKTSKVILFEDGSFREALQQAGIQVNTLRMPKSIFLTRRDESAIRNILTIPGVIKLALMIARQARQYDLLYANTQKAFIIGALASRIAGKPLVWHVHDLLTTDHFSPSKLRVLALFARMFPSCILVNSIASKQAFIDVTGRSAGVHLVYCGIDVAPFQACIPDKVQALRQELGLMNVPVLGHFSRLAPWKGQHVLLHALEGLPCVHALLVGTALFPADQAYAESLYLKAKQAGMADRVHFLGFRHDIPLLMHCVDLIIHTSVSPEPFGRVIVEGMLACKPVVATQLGGPSEIIDDGITGYLTPPGNSEALVDAIIKLLQDPSKAKDIAEAGHAAAIKRFSPERMLHKINHHVRHVLSSSST